MHALESDSQLIVYLDIKSPYAFIALGPTLELETDLGLRFDWRPLTLNIPSYLGSAAKQDGKVVESSGRSARTWAAIRYAYHDARRYAERQGLTLKGTEKIWDSRLANIALLWVAQHHRQHFASYARELFQRFWNRDLDIENQEVIANGLNAYGLARDDFFAFLDAEGARNHDSLQAQFHQHGIYGVPTYVLEGEVLFGREHIPWIRWRLSGANGAAPDVAYEIGD